MATTEPAKADEPTEAAEPTEADEPAERALARFTLTIWPIGDRYRMLLALARRDLGAERVDEVLAPARDQVTAILARGQESGAFHGHVPPGALSAALETLTLSLLESVNREPGRTTARRPPSRP
ncbi:hypothetical protein NKH77_38665 [Streptomyces sp. M19]